MATIEELTMAVGCLSTVFPQYIAKELANLTDQITTAIQGFTDPLAALGDLHVDKLVGDVASLSEGDTYGALAGAAVGLASQYAKREVIGMLGSMGMTSRISDMEQLAGKVTNSASLMMSLFPDMPYAVAQRMCKTIIQADDIKIANLECLGKHIVQLTNAILVLAKTGTGFRDRTFANLQKVEAFVQKAQDSLVLSQRLLGNSVVFDSNAFDRAQQALTSASVLLTPATGGTTILDLAEIATFGSLDTAHASIESQQLTALVIPSLIAIVEAEVGAVVSQVQVINFYVSQLGTLIATFRKIGQASKIQTQRATLIRDIQGRLDDLMSQIGIAIDRGDLRAASAAMLLWSSRVKSILATMESVKNLTLQEGSIEGPDKAFELQQAFQQLLITLVGLHDDATVAGIESPLVLRDQVLALTKGARRIMKNLEDGKTDPTALANFHELARVTATSQVSRTQRSSALASQQKVACDRFASIDLQFGPRFDSLLGSMRQLGLDRGVDMLSSGAFQDFLDADISSMSYIGTAITCLQHGIDGTDDAQTKQQLGAMRDDLIGKQTNQNIAAVNAADDGRSRFIDRLKSQMDTIQQNAKTVESIVSSLQGLLAQAGGALDQSLAGLAKFNAFLGNLDHLAVKAGGRLASDLEEQATHPNTGVVACDGP